MYMSLSVCAPLPRCVRTCAVACTPISLIDGEALTAMLQFLEGFVANALATAPGLRSPVTGSWYCGGHTNISVRAAAGRLER